MIRYLNHSEIDKAKWDRCIAGSVNELIYAYSWYLDVVSPGWDALVDSDYESVMPLTWNRKFGIYYLYGPYFAQQLGVFSVKNTDENKISEFINNIPQKFRLIQINLNTFNKISDSSVRVTLNKNYELDISGSYSTIYGSYTRNCRRNIKKAIDAKLTVDDNISTVEFMQFVMSNLGDRLPELSRENFRTLIKLLDITLENGTGRLCRVVTREGLLCAAGSFLYTSRRCIFSVCASSDEGKLSQAMYMLVDSVIKSNSGKSLIFDFSGSNIKGIAYFNSTFGARPLEYPYIYRNNLPWFIRFLK
jgi:hypothetical protein